MYPSIFYVLCRVAGSRKLWAVALNVTGGVVKMRVSFVSDRGP